jgi:hypothetical protein
MPPTLSGYTGEYTISAPPPRTTSPRARQRQRGSEIRVLEAVEHLLATVPPHGLDEISTRMEHALEVPEPSPELEVPEPSPEEADIIADILGEPVHGKQERAEIELDALMRSFRHRRELLENSLTSTQVADLLGVSRQTPHDRVKSGTLIAVLDHGAWRFPRWQFDSEGPDGVVPGLPEVLQTLRISPLNKMSWLVHPNPDLEEAKTPLQALRDGQYDVVKELAEVVGVT